MDEILNRVKKPLDKIQEWWTNNPNAKVQSIVIGVVAVVLLIGVPSILPFLSNSMVNQDGSNSLGTNTVAPNFDDSSRLEKLSTVSIGISNPIIVDKSQSTFFDQDLKLNIANKSVEGSTSFIPLSLYNKDGSTIINENGTTTIYNSQESSFKQLQNNIFFLTPNESKYLYMYPNSKSFVIREITDYTKLETANTLGTIRPNLNTGLFEIQIINQKPYFLFWQNPNRTGTLEIWRQEKSEFKLIHNIANVELVKLDSGGIIYSSSTSGERLNSFVLDFTRQVDGEKYSLNFDSQLQQKGIQGQLLANRCAFYKNNTLACLIKKDGGSENDFTKSDEITILDYINNQISAPFSNLYISGKSLYFNHTDLYLISQEDQYLFRIISN